MQGGDIDTAMDFIMEHVSRKVGIQVGQHTSQAAR